VRFGASSVKKQILAPPIRGTSQTRLVHYRSSDTGGNEEMKKVVGKSTNPRYRLT
jgi:hypothetical protein